MKKRYLILAGILAASMLAAGCGKEELCGTGAEGGGNGKPRR